MAQRLRSTANGTTANPITIPAEVASHIRHLSGLLPGLVVDQPGVNRRGGALGSHAFQGWRHAMLSHCKVPICLVGSDRLNFMGLTGIGKSNYLPAI